MKTSAMNSSQRGFSMIEVLIAVVVLGFGLMALAALQTTIIRSSAETKAQTVALQLAKDKIEDLRSFQDLAGYKAVTSSGGNEDFNLSNVDFTRSWVVERFAYRPSTGVFVNVSSLGLIGDTPTGGTPAIYVADNEYKTIAVTVNWTDANGIGQSVRLNDAIAALSPGDGSKVVLNNANTSQARKPQVRIYDPGATGGVIPIALGNGSSTAASNPTPVRTGKQGEIKSETRFDILTYAGTSGTVLAQARVETAVVGCTCSTANAPTDTTARGYRPTFWNGYRYAPPTVTSDKPTAGWTEASTESERCIACCRDHRDPIGKGPKFDPYRENHDHYSSLDLTTKNPAIYNESCRLIRVDGVFRVASDFRSDHLGFLETNNSGTLSDTVENNRPYVPTANGKVAYQEFTLDYLYARFTANNAFDYNNPKTPSNYEPSSFNDPAKIDIESEIFAATDKSKWLHGRGLYVDWIEDDAFDIIKKASQNCPDKSSQESWSTCVLPFVPFTSINVTELANWKAVRNDAVDVVEDPPIYVDDTTNIAVQNRGFVSSIDKNIPVRGDVYSGGNPKIDSIAYAYSSMGNSNSGLTDFSDPIDYEESLVNLFDTQKFEVKYSGNVKKIKFYVKTDNQALSIGSWLDTNTCDSYSNKEKAWICDTLSPDSKDNYIIMISGYTRTGTISVRASTICGGTGNIQRPIINDYSAAITGFESNVVSGTNQVPGSVFKTSDTTYINVGKLTDGSPLTLTLTGPTELKAGFTCNGTQVTWTNIYN